VRRGRPILGAFAGLLLGLFVAFDLIVFKAVASDSSVLAVLPIAGLILGIVLGLWAPLGRRRVAVVEGPPVDRAPAPPPAPDADPPAG
jgi:hypothetical protein